MNRRLLYLAWVHVLCWPASGFAQVDGSAPPAAVSGTPPAPAPLPPINSVPAPQAAPSTPAPQSAPPPSASARARFAVDTERPPTYAPDEHFIPALELDEALRLRALNTWWGPVGGVRVVDAGSGPAGTARLQFGFDYFSKSDFLLSGDQNESLGGVMALSVTPIEHLEAYASLSTRANSNDFGDPILLQVAGDFLIGAKGFAQVLPWLGVGGDLRFMFLNTIGDLGVILKGTSVGIRGEATADLRRIEEPMPLVLRANLEYLVDNSSALVEGVEAARYELLSPLTRKSIENEDRHLVNRIERFALGINRVDMIWLSLGGEAPFQVDEDFFLQPLLEWRLGIPVNRQGYSCLAVATSADVNSPDDSCLAIEGLAAAPSLLTLGLRALPPVRGLSALLAFDIGLLGTSTFVRELAPNRPWAIMFSVGYTIDARKPKPEIQYVKAAEPAAPIAAPKARLRGSVVERGFGTGIVGAIVRYPDRDLSPQLTSAEGRFVSYEFDAGDVVLDVSHPDYDPGRCVATVPPLAPARPASSTSPAAPEPVFVDVKCELTARPRSGTVRGSLTDEKGAPVAGVAVSITGPSPQSAVSDAGGSFALAGLPVGEYVAVVDVPQYLLKSQPFTVSSGSDTSLQLALVPKPKDAAVTLTAKEVKIRNQIMFKTGSAEIDERSGPLLSEIADVLLRNPQVAHVQVQGHTDNVGDPNENLTLSQSRADAVVQWLVGAGVTADRLEAKGFGDTRPLVPNLTDGNRARNRRVQFIVKE